MMLLRLTHAWLAHRKSYLQLAFLLGLGLLLAACTPTFLGGRRLGPGSRYSTNGEQIYLTATSQRGTPITSDSGTIGLGMMGNGTIACATCHGPDGKGGQVRVMMVSFDAPDIRYKTLTSTSMAEDHPPYTDETIKRAITEGVDPAGQPLKPPMPRWKMSAEDLDDLLAYLKSLP